MSNLTAQRPKLLDGKTMWLRLSNEDETHLAILAAREDRHKAQYIRTLIRQAARQANLVAPVQAQEAQLS